ncbi:hypothetical protein M9H77_18268 [Catharanthus roseus]|uniref:Uncharacterized protein n=1 Tax=Catharanthus roseus TaxID=4058 RepID=A0ACC0B705_CATRO|nr:hypothetical protein M9H77_18268 [Catharanthus roseus]
MQRKILLKRIISIRLHKPVLTQCFRGRCDLLLRRRLNCSTTFCCSPPEESVDAEEKSEPELLKFMSKISFIPATTGSEFSLLLVREGPIEFGPTNKDPASYWSKSTSRDGPGVCGLGDRQVHDPGDGQRLLRWACCWAEPPGPWSC